MNGKEKQLLEILSQIEQVACETYGQDAQLMEKLHEAKEIVHGVGWTSRSKKAENPPSQSALYEEIFGELAAIELSSVGSIKEIPFKGIERIVWDIKKFSEPNPVQIPLSSPYLLEFGGLLSGIFSVTNGYSLSGMDILERTPEAWTQTEAYLRDHWGVSDRDDLHETLEWLLTNGGDAAIYETVSLSTSFEQFIQPDTDEETIRQLNNSITFVKHFRKTIGAGFLRGWDLSRAAMLVRAGYFMAFLTPEETDLLIKDIAVAASRQFDCWRSFGQSCMFGGLFWSYAKNPGKMVIQNACIWARALSALLDPQQTIYGQWAKRPWANEIF